MSGTLITFRADENCAYHLSENLKTRDVSGIIGVVASHPAVLYYLLVYFITV